jgi:hypothetical protein
MNKLLPVIKMFLSLSAIVIFSIIFLREIFFDKSKILYFNDFAPPISKDFLNKSISSIGDRFFEPKNPVFLNEAAPLFLLRLLSVFFSYNTAVNIFFAALFFLPGVTIYFLIKEEYFKIPLSCIFLFSFWYLDRVQQGHLFTISLFFCLAVVYVYLFLKKPDHKNLMYLTLLSSFSIYLDYHYSVILMFLTFIYFLCNINIFLKTKLLLKLSFLNLIILTPAILHVFLYFMSGSKVNPQELDHFIFVWQAKPISTLLQIRYGMLSGHIFNIQDAWVPVVLTFLVSIVAYLNIFLKNKSKYIKISVIFILLISSLGFLIDKSIYIYIMNFPLLSVIRDTNKVVGVLFLFLLFSFGLVETKRNFKISFFLVSTILLFLYVLYNPFSFFIKKDVDYEVLNFISKQSETFIYLNKEPNPVIKNRNYNYHFYPFFSNTLFVNNVISYPFSYQSRQEDTETRVIIDSLLEYLEKGTYDEYLYGKKFNIIIDRQKNIDFLIENYENLDFYIFRDYFIIKDFSVLN